MLQILGVQVGAVQPLQVGEQRRALGLPTDLPYGSLGENLTLSGVLETSLTTLFRSVRSRHG